MKFITGVLFTLALAAGVVRLTYDVSYFDPTDHVACDVYRVGGWEVNVCQYSTGYDEGGAL